jgi:perosamine synthetase
VRDCGFTPKLSEVARDDSVGTLWSPLEGQDTERGSELIPVFRPSFGDEELEALREPFRSGWLGLGPKTAEFEKEFAEYVGAKYAVGLNSATAALHLALAVFDIQAGDEVLVSPLTFVSSVHAILYCGATPVFVDIRPDTLCMDVEDLKRKISPRAKAIIAVHFAGHPCDLEEIQAVAKQNKLLVIEDAAHACGSEYQGRKIGSIGDVTCFSFHAVKNLATGDGGMITTDRLELVRRLHRLRWVGIDKSTWERTEEVQAQDASGIRKYASYGWYYEVHDLGFKCHMNDIAAAIGLVQLGKLDRANQRRRDICATYTSAFQDIDWIEVPVELDHVRSACHAYVIKTPYRDELNLYLRDKGIATGVHYMPVHLHPYYHARFPAVVPTVEDVWPKLLTLPLFPDLTASECDHIIESIRSFIPR